MRNDVLFSPDHSVGVDMQSRSLGNFLKKDMICGSAGVNTRLANLDHLPISLSFGFAMSSHYCRKKEVEEWSIPPGPLGSLKIQYPGCVFVG